MSARNKTNEIYITRIYDAPVKMVWDAWNDPQQAAQWWGPRGHSIVTHSKDLRNGGSWKYTMTGPEGQTWENVTKYLEVIDQKRLVYDHGGNETSPPLFRVTVEFKELRGEKTQMDMTMAVATAEAANETKKFIKKAGGNSTWDRLGEFLAKENGEKEIFVINRTFEAPIEKMFEVWTNPEHFQQWLPPTGMTMQFLRAEIKPGGTSFYKMTNGKDVTMFGRMHYREIERPTRIVFSQEFTDDKENISRHPFAPTWPASLLTTVTLNEEQPGLTRITVQSEVDGKVTADELQAFMKERGGMTQGWTGSFDKLEEILQRK